MNILVSGASGLVGTELVKRLRETGHEVRTLTRRSKRDVYWDPETGAIDGEALKRWGGPDAVVHLAGENIASHRWSEKQKKRIRESRVQATEKLARTVATPIFITASAVGYYGNRGDELLTEESPPGDDFLAEICVDWEEAAAQLRGAGTRVVHLRFGMILARHGGALRKMYPIFKVGLGGRLGSGRQWVSWIALEDVVRIITFALEKQELDGACNAVAPNPVTNRDFTRELAHALRRPAVIPAPAFALRFAFGEMADALLLTSQRAIPKRLQELGFTFKYPDLPSAFATIFQR